MADGSIRISTKLDTSTLKQQIKELERELDKVRKEQAKADAKAEQIRASYDAEREIDSQFPEQFSHKDIIDERESKALGQIAAEQEELNRKEQEYVSRLAEANAKLAEQERIMSAVKQMDDAVKTDSATAKLKNQADYNSALDATVAKMQAMELAAERIAAQTGLTKEQILNANPAYQKLSDTMGILKARASDFGDEARAAGTKTKVAMTQAEKSTKRVGDATRRGIAGFGRMQLAMMGIMFAMRAISAATQEYMAVNTQLEGQINTLKALWGQVLGPVIEWVINLLIQAISYVNAFIYALSGINLVAKANEAALKKQAKASSGGGKGGGNQTASFDEQTKLTNTSGGAGGTGGAVATLPDGTTIDMSFLDPLKEALKKFYEDIKPLLTTLKALGKWILDNILIPLADWVANSVLPAFLNILGAAALVLNDALWKLQPIALWIWENFLEPIASWTGGVIVDVLNAIGNWIREHKETLSTVVAIAIALGAALVVIPKVLGLVSTAFSVLSAAISSPITWLIALIALFVTLYDECEGFRKGMNEAWEGVKGIFKGAVDFIKALFKGDWAGMDEAWEKIKTSGKDLLTGLWEGLKAGWEWIKEKLVNLWKKISTAFCEFFGIHSPSTLFLQYGEYMIQGLINGIKAVISSVVETCKGVWTKIQGVFSSVGGWFKDKFSNAGSSIASAFTGALSKIKNACNTIWTAIKGVFSSVTTWFKDTFTAAWTAVKNVFSTGGKIFSGIKEGISSTFKTIVNGLIAGINKIIATPFNAINKMLNTIRSTSVLGIQPFKNLWSYNPLSVPKIPKLARGGIVNRPGQGVPAIIGEAGREAVLPLDNYTEWMDILADKINGSGTITIPIYMDGKKIYTYMVDIGKRKAFAANGG